MKIEDCERIYESSVAGHIGGQRLYGDQLHSEALRAVVNFVLEKAAMACDAHFNENSRDLHMPSSYSRIVREMKIDA